VSQEDKPEEAAASGMQRIEAPAGIDLHPKPARAVLVSKRAVLAAMLVGGGILFSFAYGGYRRQQRQQVAAQYAGLPQSVAPATSAGNEFVQAIPTSNASASQNNTAGQLQPAGTYGVASSNPAPSQNPCGFDSRNGQAWRFNPQTGQPCATGSQQDRVVIRQASPPQYATTSAPQPTPEEQRVAAAYQREREALLAPTGIRSENGDGVSSLPLGGASRPDDLPQFAALRQALPAQSPDGNAVAAPGRALSPTNSPAADVDYEGQNMQTRKEAFLVAARSQKTGDYLRSTRSAPLGAYEIKAGWEIPAVLEQNLNSDLPGDLKALIMSNVYDTATGSYLLIPQGARLIGRYDSRVSYGQDGVQVVWDRIIFPDASSVDINGMVGLDAHGNSGLRDKVDRHYKRLFGFSALTSMFTAAFDLSQRRAYGSGLAYPSIGDTASAAVGRDLSQTGSEITRRNLNVQPTIKVPAGYKFTVRVNRDILFDAPYEAMRPDPQPALPEEPKLQRRTGSDIAANRR
jgi:type IV secretion system protein VirB10